MNPEKNEFEPLTIAKCFEQSKLTPEMLRSKLVRPNGEPVPEHWSIFTVDELYEINGYTFRCKYIGKTSILFEPVSPGDVLNK